VITTLFGFFRFSSVEQQARFNTDAIFVGALAAILLLGLAVYGLIKLMELINDNKVVLRAAMQFTAQQEETASRKIDEGRAQLSTQIQQSKTELGDKIDHVAEVVTNSGGGSGVNLGGPS
jgi:hypothetical protein